MFPITSLSQVSFKTKLDFASHQAFNSANIAKLCHSIIQGQPALWPIFTLLVHGRRHQ